MIATARPLHDHDQLLLKVCELLQLTATQQEIARSGYTGVSEWLAAEGSPLAPLNPRIYPQGSMRIDTTVRPWVGEEFDLDIVCELASDGSDAMALFELLARRVAAHGTYGPMMSRLKRCIRLEYAGNFHLDILPARPDRARGNTCLLVPDRKVEGWKPSNPEGYAQWFQGRGRVLAMGMRADIRPLDAPEPAAEKSTLCNCVQLLKRYRDFYFKADVDSAPRSIVLTTLAAKHYRGESSILAGLDSILAGIAGELAVTSGILVVPNPTNEAENFAEAWTDLTFAAFRRFVRDSALFFGGLTAIEDLPQLVERAASVLGQKEVLGAHRWLMDRIGDARSKGILRATTAGLTVEQGGRRVERNTFFGA